MEARILKRGREATEAQLGEKRDRIRKAMIQLVTNMTAGRGMTTAEQRADEAEQTVRDCWIGPKEASFFLSFLFRAYPGSKGLAAPQP